MKFNTRKNAKKNIISGTMLKIYQIVIPFLIRTAMIYYMGIQFVGLNSFFTSILGILNLIELGIGSAIVFSMYKPVAEDDEVTICALLQLYKIYYRIIGCVILIIGLIIFPFIPYLIKNDMPYGINVYTLYLINLFTTVLSYWIFAYNGSVLIAHQRNDIGNKIMLIVNTVQYIIQFFVLVYIKNYYIYVVIALLTQVIVNIICAIIASKMYPQYKAYGKLDKEKKKEVNQRMKDLSIIKMSWVIISYSDTIIISAFLGLTILAIYNNYIYIVNSILGIVGVIFSSYAAGVGNSLILESTEKNYNDFNKLTFLIIWISCLFTSELLCLYQPFMKFWVGQNLTLNFIMVILFCIYYYVYEISSILELYKDSAGIWHRDKFRVIIMAVVKLLLNIILVNIIGIYSIPISTIISMVFIGLPWIIHNLFNEVFKISKKQYIIKLFMNSLLVVIISIVCYAITSLIKGSSLIVLFLKAFVCLGINTLLMYVIHRNTPEFRSSKDMIINSLLNIVDKKKIKD